MNSLVLKYIIKKIIEKVSRFQTINNQVSSISFVLSFLWSVNYRRGKKTLILKDKILIFDCN